MDDHDFVLVPRPNEDSQWQEGDQTTPEYLPSINAVISGLRDSLWELSSFIHDNPELGFSEYKAHDALTNFMLSQDVWEVTKSACGMETAWTSSFDTGRPGPVVSFNVEMGMHSQV